MIKLILFIAWFGLAAVAEPRFSPGGKTWVFAGSDVPGATMDFKPDGRVVLKSLDQKPAYAWLGQVTWTYQVDKKLLVLAMPNAKDKDLRNEKVGIKAPGFVYAREVDLQRRSVTYDFPNRIDFFGVVFEQATP